MTAGTVVCGTMISLIETWDGSAAAPLSALQGGVRGLWSYQARISE